MVVDEDFLEVTWSFWAWGESMTKKAERKYFPSSDQD